MILWFLAGVFGVIAQAAEQPLIQKKIEYEVIRSDNARVTAREGCFGLKFITVYIVPTSATKEKIESFTRQIAGTFPDKYDLIIEFTIDRYLTLESSSTAEDLWLRNLRGLYVRTGDAKVGRSFSFPNGTSRGEFEKLLEIEEN